MKFSKAKFIKFIEQQAPFMLVIACVASLRFVDSIAIVFPVLLITMALYAWRRYDSRILVGTAMLVLIVCTIFLATGRDPHANEAAIIAYYFLAMGVLGLFIDYLRLRR